jgi:hypothetical protein
MITGAPQTANPLYLRMLLDELLTTAVFETVKLITEQCLHAKARAPSKSATAQDLHWPCIPMCLWSQAATLCGSLLCAVADGVVRRGAITVRGFVWR